LLNFFYPLWGVYFFRVLQSIRILGYFLVFLVTISVTIYGLNYNEQFFY